MSAFPQIAMYGHYIQKWSIQFSLLLIRFVFSECWLKLIFAELHVTIMIIYWNSILLKCHITNKILKLHLRNKAQLLNPEHNSQSRNIYANICNKPFSTCINMEYMQYVHLTLPRISLLYYKLWKLLPQNWKHLYLAHSWIKKRYEKFSTDYVWITRKQFPMYSRFICCRYNLYWTTNGYVTLCVALRITCCSSSVDVVGLQNSQADTCDCSWGTPC